MAKIAFSIGNISIYWFGLVIALAILVGLWVSLRECLHRGYSAEPVLDLVLYGVPVAFVLARFAYIIFEGQLIGGRITESLLLWPGGLNFHGAWLGFVISLLVYAKLKSIQFWKMADIVAPGLAIGQAIGQWGNFIIQEGFGYPTESGWGIYIDYMYRPPGYEQFDFFQPIFLFEFCWYIFNFLVLLLISWLQKLLKKIPSGTVFLSYLLLHSLAILVFADLYLQKINDYGLSNIIAYGGIIGAVYFISIRACNTRNI